jgi:hypothetical protein
VPAGACLGGAAPYSFYGYKNHLGVDKAHKLIRKWDATDAAVHDSQKLDSCCSYMGSPYVGQKKPRQGGAFFFVQRASLSFQACSNWDSATSRQGRR